MQQTGKLRQQRLKRLTAESRTYFSRRCRDGAFPLEKFPAINGWASDIAARLPNAIAPGSLVGIYRSGG
jgi:hypothetical protein